MFTSIRTAAITAFVLIAAAATAHAQAPAGQKYVIHRELAKPSMIAQYEATSKEFVAMVKENRAAMPHFSFNALQGEDYSYSFIAPISKMGDMDLIMDEFGALAMAAGPKFGDLMMRGGEAMESYSEVVVQRVDDLCYRPANPRLKPEEMMYWQYDFYYLKPGHDQHALELAKEFKALWASKGLRTGYELYIALTGQELPLLVVGWGSKDPADAAAVEAADNPVLGDAGKALFAKAFAITRRFETKNAWFRPDLSVPPVMAAK